MNLVREEIESSSPVCLSKNDWMPWSSDIVRCMCEAGVSAAASIEAGVVAKFIRLGLTS